MLRGKLSKSTLALLTVFLCGSPREGCKLTPGQSRLGWLNLTGIWEATDGGYSLTWYTTVSLSLFIFGVHYWHCTFIQQCVLVRSYGAV